MKRNLNRYNKSVLHFIFARYGSEKNNGLFIDDLTLLSDEFIQIKKHLFML